MFSLSCSEDEEDEPTPATSSNGNGAGGNNGGNSNDITLNNLSDSTGAVKIEGSVNKTIRSYAEYNTQITYFDHTGYEYRLNDTATTDYVNVTLVMADSAGNVLPKPGTYTIVDDNNPPMGDYVTVGFRSNDTLNEYFSSAAAAAGTVKISNVNNRKLDIELEVDSLTAFSLGQTVSVDVSGAMKAR
ncbi:MAG: hypothetical protein RIC95_00350 [Vicingaceae bacterium]